MLLAVLLPSCWRSQPGAPRTHFSFASTNDNLKAQRPAQRRHLNPLFKRREAVMDRTLVITVFVAVAACWPARAWAGPQEVQIPAGATVTLDGSVLCPPLPPGWGVDAARRTVSVNSAAPIGSHAEVRLASESAACPTATTARWTVTGRLATLDPAGVTLWADEGRLELRGKGLAGTTVEWQAGKLVRRILKPPKAIIRRTL